MVIRSASYSIVTQEEVYVYIFVYVYILKIYLFSKPERGREGDLQMAVLARAGPGQKQEPGLQYEYWEPHHLGHLLLLFPGH